MATQVLQGTLVLPDRLVESGQVVIEEGVIQEGVTAGSSYPPTEDFGSAYIAPGFIDLHTHGIAGANVMDGSPDSLALMARRLAVHGVTGFLPTTVTESLDRIRRAIECVRDIVAVQDQDGARIMGIHLEGPWVAPAFKGMQKAEHIVPPDEDVARGLLSLGTGVVKRVTLAPELPGADRLIALLRVEGVAVSMAHSGATYEQAQDAVSRGVEQVTHCFNAMTGLHHRHPGLVGAALTNEALYTELIADGIHLHPAVMRLLVRVKGRERVTLVTDAMPATELPDGDYRFGGHDVFVRDGAARLADGTLAGSTLTMDAAVRNVIRLCGVSLVDAVRMAATTPAEAMGWGSSKGKIESGYDADLVILDASLQPLATWINGVQVYG